MFRVLTNRGLPERSIAAKYRSLSMYHEPFRHTPRQSYTRSLLCTPPSSQSLSRRLSSSASTTSKDAYPKAAEPLAPNKSNRQKPKVELRPAPVKPSPSKSTSAKTSASKTQPPTKTTTSNQEKKPSHTTSSPNSITETAKKDLADAFKQGILVPPPDHYPWYRKLFHQAKELFRFYWRGLKMINVHRKQVNEINERVRNGGEPISRAEARFIRTYREDALKLVPFLIIVLILEEIIPLIAIYVPSMLPSTCILPSQAERIEQQKREKQLFLINNSRRVFDNLRLQELPDQERLPFSALRGNVFSSTTICGLLRISAMGMNGTRIRKIQRYFEWIAKDDALLIREDMGARLTSAEIVEALHERGIVTFGMSEKERQARLRWWLLAVERLPKGDPITRRLFLVCKNAAT